MQTKTTLTLRLLAAGAGVAMAAAGGCASGVSDKNQVGWETSPLHANPVSLELRTEVLQVPLPAQSGGMLRADIANIELFVAAYEQRGAGPLVLSLPADASNAQLAIQSAADVRDIAWSRGVDYTQVKMRTYDAAGVAAAPLVLAFDTYEAVAPDCPLFSSFDMSDITDNSEMKTFGCAVRSNFAAMLAEPEDLAGRRALDAPNLALATSKFEQYSQGQATGSAVGAEASVGGGD